MKKILGSIMIAAPFVVILFNIAMQVGITKFLLGLSLTVLCVLYVKVAMDLWFDL